MKTLPISLLIPTMNRPQSLRRTLDSYFSATAIPAELIVVDQSPEPEIIADNRNIVESYAGKTRAVYLHREIPSSSAARNAAVAASTQKLLLFCDDDVEVQSLTLDRLFGIFERNTVALVAAVSEKKIRQSPLGYLAGTRSFFRKNTGHITASLLGRYPNVVKKEAKTEWAMGFFFAVRKDLITKWNLSWDENFTGYGFSEDLDYTMTYCRKAKNEGLQCILSGELGVLHFASQEYRISNEKYLRMYVLNRSYLFQKHRLRLYNWIAMQWTNYCVLAELWLKKENTGTFLDALRENRKRRRECEL